MLNEKYKTIMCKYTESYKICPLGSKCHFAHTKAELRSINDPLPTNAPCIAGNNNQGETADESLLNPKVLNNYKSEICRYWELGKCKYNQNCSYAHGNNDLRNQDLIKSNEQNTNVDILKDSNIEFHLRQHQLYLIANKILETYKGNKKAELVGNQVLELLGKNYINASSDLLMKFLYAIDNTDEEMIINKGIIMESVKFAKDYMEFLKSNEFKEYIKVCLKNPEILET